jgi:DNA polymerase/3'-5' exonuclease PolX
MDADPLNHNKELADLLSLISQYYSWSSDPKDKYKAKSFYNASINIANHPIAILSGAQARSEVKGVGKSIAEVIDEYFETGSVQRLIDLETKFQNQTATIDLFRSVYGIGPVTAFKLYNQGYRTLEDLWYRAPLTQAQKIGIQWYEHLKLPIARTEMDLINQTIGSYLDPYGIKWEITGSYRRQEPFSNDIDILVQAQPDLNLLGVVTVLRDILPADLAMGPTKYMGVLRLPEYNGHRIDIRLVPPQNWPFALMYFTGSQRFNILMRARAIQLKYKLNEYGLYDSHNQPLPASSEDDIFHWLHVTYLPPIARTRTLQSLELQP